MDDEMDQQQCGDIDDDDYDQKNAEKGDDKAVNAELLEKELEQEEGLEGDSEDDDPERENLDAAGKDTKRMLEGKPRKNDEDDDEDEEQEQDQKEGKEEEDKPKKASKKKHETIPTIKISLAQKPSAAASSSLGKRATAEAADGAGQAVKKVKTEGGGGGGASGGIEARVRTAIQMDKNMSIKKLMNLLGIKKSTPEVKADFTEVVKRICQASRAFALPFRV
jgi:hypothetical protein